MKNFLLTLLVSVSAFLFCSTGCINNFSISWGFEQERFANAINACSLLPGGGPGCVNHAYEEHDRRIQDIDSDYDCCEFNDC